jgi:hypothetical protein
MAVMLVLLMERNYEMHYLDRSGSMTYIPSFMKIFTDIEGILRFCLSNLKDSNVGITDDRGL